MHLLTFPTFKTFLTFLSIYKAFLFLYMFVLRHDYISIASSHGISVILCHLLALLFYRISETCIDSIHLTRNIIKISANGIWPYILNYLPQ